MKKGIVLSLLFCMSITTPVMAEEQPAQPEVMFRNIPWGTTFTEFKNCFPGITFYDNYYEERRPESTNEVLFDEDSEPPFSDKGFTAQVVTYDEIEVAGYTAKETRGFVLMPIENGEVVQNIENATLYGADYKIEPRDVYAARDDIVIKLTSIYGEPTGTKQLQTSSIEESATYWELETGMISVRLDDIDQEVWTSLEDALYICYLDADADALLREANENIANGKNNAESSVYGNSDTNGL